MHFLRLRKIPNGPLRIEIQSTAEGTRIVKLFSSEMQAPSLVHEFETKYTVELIEALLKTHGAASLWDEIRRDEDPTHIRRRLGALIEAHGIVPSKTHRILDFGCGAGASTLNLSRFFPSAEVIGIEPQRQMIEVARKRADFWELSNISFLPSESDTKLPEVRGPFDLILLNAVYEHLLPDERRLLLPQLWRALRPQGIVIITATPHRYYPFEIHSTSLPLINYLPDSLAFHCAKKFSRRVCGDPTWESLLKGGIRGGTPRGVLAHLTAGNLQEGEILVPRGENIKDSVDLWWSATDPLRSKFQRRVAFVIGKIGGIFGLELLPSLEMAIRKV